MSKYNYDESRRIAATEPPFYALLMACMRRADTGNYKKLRIAFPAVAQELAARYEAPGGVLDSDPAPATESPAESADG